MIDYGLFQILVLVFKIFSYSEEIDYAVVDMIEESRYSASFVYNQENDYTLKISVREGIDAESVPAFTVRTIDNALYSVDFEGSEDNLTLDLAPFYQSADWDHLKDKPMPISDGEYGNYYLYQSNDNIILSDSENSRLLILNRKYLDRKAD